MIDFVATDRHFVDHIRPVYEALPAEMRGAFFTYREYAKLDLPKSARAGSGDMVLVCSFGDLRYVWSNRRPTIFMEHGAGFTFPGKDFGSYAGHWDRPNVVQFLCQNDQVLRANQSSHRKVAAEVIGVPKLDPWHVRLGLEKPAQPRPKRRGSNRPGANHRSSAGITVALALHWDCLLTGGTRSAIAHYVKALPGLVALCDARGWELIGHAHPRMALEFQFLCSQLGVEYVPELSTVFDRADVMIADATSAMYEFASFDRPVLSLNAPWYREEPDTGIRFWQHIPGVQVDEPADLCDQLEVTVADEPAAQAARHEAVDFVYPIRGHAAEAAVAAIQRYVASCR